MNSRFILLTIITLFMLSFQTGCPRSLSTNEDTPENSRVSPSTDTPSREETDGERPDRTSVDLESESDIDELIEEAALAFVEKLGYDPALVRIAGKDLEGIDERVLWAVHFDNESGPFAEVIVDEEDMQVEMMRFIGRDVSSVPETLEPGEDLPERVAEALGLAELGFRPGPVMPDLEHMVEYRKYVTSDDWEVCVGQFTMMINPTNGRLEGIHWTETELIDRLTVLIDRETAIEAAKAYLGDPDLSDINTELIQLQSGASPIFDLRVFWEVIFDGSVVRVNCYDGTIM